MIKVVNRRRKWLSFKVYDLEWDPHTMKMRVGVVHDGHNYKVYHKPEELLNDQLRPCNSGLTYYAHNGGRSDFSYLIQYLKENNYNVSAAFANSSAFLVHVRKGKCKWTFVDSLWIFQSSLAQIGKCIGMDKGGPPVDRMQGDTPEETRRMVADWYAYVPLPELTDYCKNDTEILWQAIHEFQCELWGMGSELRSTIAASALRLFQRRYLSDNIQTVPEVNEHCRESYKASRVEVIRKHIQHGWYLDICSSFPYSMTKPQPGNLKSRYLRLANDLSDAVPLVLARCRVRVPEMELPPLPYKYRHRIFFPTGEWESWFMGVDLQALLERGGEILSCDLSYEFHPFHDLGEYVHDVYDRRLKAQATGNLFKSMVYKILLNSLYGKFGESAKKMQIIINPTKKEVEKHNLYPWREPTEEEKDFPIVDILPGVWGITKEVTVPHMHVPIASNVTALSRRLILEKMEMAQQAGGRAYYCDTDGFATDVLLETSNRLGDLKIENEFTEGNFHVPKVYDFVCVPDKNGEIKRRVKAKGFNLPRGSQIDKEKQYDELIRQAYSHENMGIKIEHMTRVREILSSVDDLTPQAYDRLKRLHLDSPKRLEYDDGTSRPYTIDEVHSLFES